MIVRPIATQKVVPGDALLELLDAALGTLPERGILAVTSKIVSLCEGRVVPIDKADKASLVRQESQRYLPTEASKYHAALAITKNTLAPNAGIDASNADNNYVLWPANPQATANQIRAYLAGRFKLKEVGVVITDSACTPLRWGTIGVALAHSGFAALHDYVGQPDLFGRRLESSQANIAGGLAAAAVLVMGEGAESTPLAIIEDTSNVAFQPHDPTPEELQALVIEPQDDLFAPLLTSVAWLKGDKAS